MKQQVLSSSFWKRLVSSGRELSGGREYCFFRTRVCPNNSIIPDGPNATLSITVFSKVSFSYSTDLRQFAVNFPNVFLNLVLRFQHVQVFGKSNSWD